MTLNRLKKYDRNPRPSQAKSRANTALHVEGSTILQVVEAVDRPIPIFLRTLYYMPKKFEQP